MKQLHAFWVVALLLTGCATSQQPAAPSRTIQATVEQVTTNSIPAGTAFIFAQGDDASGKAEIWAVDGIRIEPFKLKSHGQGALLKSGDHTIRIRFEKPLQIAGEKSMVLSLPVSILSGHIYSVIFSPAIHPQTGRPTYHIWIKDITAGKVITEGPYLSPL